MNNLDVNAVIVKHFRFHDQSVRAIIQHHQTWFDVEDICQILGFKNVDDTIGTLSKSDLMKLNYWDVQKDLPVLISEIWGYDHSLNQYLINEFGVTTLLMRSNYRGPLRYWLAHKIMPAIIPTGNRKRNDRYQHHKMLLMKFGWRMIQLPKRGVY